MEKTHCKSGRRGPDTSCLAQDGGFGDLATADQVGVDVRCVNRLVNVVDDDERSGAHLAKTSRKVQVECRERDRGRWGMAIKRRTAQLIKPLQRHLTGTELSGRATSTESTKSQGFNLSLVQPRTIKCKTRALRLICLTRS